jgi:hypothetical protein
VTIATINEADPTHLANFTVGAQTPQFRSPALCALASDWRVSGILNARSGIWLMVVSGRDDAFNGMANQRVDQVSGDVYGAKTVTNYLNPAAFGGPIETRIIGCDQQSGVPRGGF